MKQVLLSLALLTCAACTSSGSGSSTSPTTSVGNAGSAGSGSLDSALVGDWFAGRGGTTAGYDPTTGASTANGDGLEFSFHAGGTYNKVLRSVESGGCTMGFLAFEEGTVTSDGNKLHLHPTKGHTQWTSCSGAADTDTPNDVKDETMTFTLAPFSADSSLEGLTLVSDTDGSHAEFRRVSE